MIFNLFRSTDEQEETGDAYQSWRDENPDNPSDDDFYIDDDCDDETGDEPENVKPWLGWFFLAFLLFVPMAHAEKKPIYYSGRMLMEMNNYKIIETTRSTTSDPNDLNLCTYMCRAEKINQGGNSVDRDRRQQYETTNNYLVPFFMRRN